MRKILVAPLLGMGFGGTAFGQGVISFNNYISTTYNQVMYATDPDLGALSGKPVTSGTVELQLFYIVGNVSSDSISAFYSTATAGVTTFIDSGNSFNGGGYYEGPNQILTGWNATTVPNVTFGVEAWETDPTKYGGATFATSGMSGLSSLWVEGPGANANSNGIQPSSNPSKGFLVGPPVLTLDGGPAFPEPSQFALSTLCAASLMLSRRKK